MPTAAFKIAKTKGRWFEALTRTALAERGFEVIDSERLKYSQKKGWDCEVRIKGERCKMEIKYDELSETTGNICVELAALRQSLSPIWIYGLPQGSKIDLYTMYLKNLTPYAVSYPIKRLVGEFKLPAALIPKQEFISQPFIKHFATINKESVNN